MRPSTLLFSLLLLGTAFGLTKADNLSDQKCKELSEKGAGFAHSIGQLKGRLVLITPDFALYQIDGTHLNGSRLFLKGATTEPLKDKFPGRDPDGRRNLKDSLFFPIQNSSSPQIWEAYTQVVGNTPRKAVELLDLNTNHSKGEELEPRAPFDINFALISSSEDKTFYLLQDDFSIAKFSFGNSSFQQVGTRLRLCPHGGSNSTEQLIFQPHNESCPRLHLKFEFPTSPNSPKTFAGFTDQSHFYLFEQNLVYIFEHQAVNKAGSPFDVITVPYSTFVNCNDTIPTEPILQSGVYVPLLIVGAIVIAVAVVLYLVFKAVTVYYRKDMRRNVLHVSK